LFVTHFFFLGSFTGKSILFRNLFKNLLQAPVFLHIVKCQSQFLNIVKNVNNSSSLSIYLERGDFIFKFSTSSLNSSKSHLLSLIKLSNLKFSLFQSLNLIFAGINQWKVSKTRFSAFTHLVFQSFLKLNIQGQYQLRFFFLTGFKVFQFSQ